MPEITNLASKIEKQLPTELVDFMRRAGEVATSRGQSLYLVGGMVRDLLLERTNLDLDLVVEGDAINLAQQLRELYQGKITTHPRFNTAKLQWDKWSVDLATARSETYAKPGALPTVKPSSLASDLFRRDFTINTMAIELIPNHYGQLIDPHRGRDDLEQGLIRILHERSFIDDSTRIWRGLRYEQRLDFQLEPNTLRLLKRDIPRVDTISGDRIRHELELTLKEEFPETYDQVSQALQDFLFSQPLAVKTANGLWMSHSLPADRWQEEFNPHIFVKPIEISDCSKPGDVYLLTWGRNMSQPWLDKLAATLKTRLFILGHQPQPQGWNQAGSNLLLVASDHNHGCLVHTNLQDQLSMEDLTNSIVPLSSIA